ncbi:MAG: hypothetical protein E6R03_12910 [Hyphomicrobiaceae bacterium]|nr:MAG: hypothetical protein E6R03_12910 [Hyphomicrobiaceae bacterium]
MNQDSPEFQDACQAAAERVMDLILTISKEAGQNQRTAVSGALGAICECMINFRPDGMSEEVAAAKAVATLELYAAQHLDGARVAGHDKVIN